MLSFPIKRQGHYFSKVHIEKSQVDEGLDYFKQQHCTVISKTNS